MQNLRYLESLASFLRQRFPERHVQRIVGELTDHLEDAGVARNEDAVRIFGHSDKVAEQFVSEFRARSFAGRHPWLCLLTVPFFGTLLTILVCVGACVCVLIELLPTLGIDVISSEQPSEFGFAFAVFCVHGISLLSFALATFMTARVWRLTARGSWWMIGAMVLQVLVAAMICSELSLSPEQLSVSVHFGTDVLTEHSLSGHRQIAGRMMIPLLVVVSVVSQRRQVNVVELHTT